MLAKTNNNSRERIDPVFAEVEEKLSQDNQNSNFFNVANFIGMENTKQSHSAMGMSPHYSQFSTLK